MTRARYVQNRTGQNDVTLCRPWSPEEIGRAVKLRREKRSAAYIGKALGRTRNSVIGALHRAGEPGVLKSWKGTTWL